MARTAAAGHAGANVPDFAWSMRQHGQVEQRRRRDTCQEGQR
ncbi:MAG: hypothetical protein ABI083_11895 [Lapillicoccus sp.]